MNQGELNCRLPISLSFGSRAYVFTMAGVVSEGLEEVVYLGLLTSSMCSSSVMGVDGSGSIPLIALSCFRKLLVWS